jgi:sugar transferase (PEP-CTERM/EpsH1 system associated)
MSRRILFLTPQLPYPAHQGTALRNFGLIGGLAGRGHRVGLLSFLESDQPDPAETPLPDLCDPLITAPAPSRSMGQRLRALLAGHADMARRLWSEDLCAALIGLLAQEVFDVVHIEGIEMAPYLSLVGSTVPDGTLLVYDAHNAEYALQWRIAGQDVRVPRRWPVAVYSLIQARRLTRVETATCRAVDHVFACSEADAAALRRLEHRTPVTVIPNAIVTGQYTDGGLPGADIPRPALVFTGKMDFRPNVDAALWFADEILPLIRQEVPDVHFVIVGKNPHTRLDVLRGRPGVTITGFVPDIRPYIQAADVYVAPLRMGSGTRFKLLEAMAMRRAVVSTRMGAEGLQVKDGHHLLLADAPADFARAVIELLKDDARRAELGANAAGVIRKYYDWEAIIPQVEAAYASVAD